MPALTPSFVFNLESKLRIIQENLYATLLEDMWWDRAARLLSSDSGKEIISFVLSTAQLDKTGLDPSVTYRPMTVLNTEVIPKYISSAIELQRAQLEDLDGNGIQIASKWVEDITTAAVYDPQKRVADAIKDGYTSLVCYDAQNLFSTVHPLNPRNIAVGTYSNVFTGNATALPATDPNAAAYPGALDVRVGTGSVTVDTAFAKLQKAFAYIGAIKMPNGLYPRRLKPQTIIAPSALFPYLQTILDAKFIAMASSGSGGGATSIEGTLTKLGYGDVVHAPEFDSEPGVFYIVCKSAAQSQLGPIVYCEREPIGVRYFTGNGGGDSIESYLSENDSIKYIARGRAEAAAGEPSLIFRCSVT